MPVAVNCCAIPLAIEGLVGVTAIDTSVAGVAVSVVAPTTAPSLAEILLVPLAATTVASPPAEIIAVPDVLETQTTDEVKSCVLPSV